MEHFVVIDRYGPLERTHAATSLALWSTLVVLLAAITVYGGWLRNFGPREFADVEVMTVSPNGDWIDVVGTAENRLDIRLRYLVSTTSNRWLRLPHGWRGSESDVVFSPDGAAAVWRGRPAGDEPRSLWWADLDRPDPSPKPTNIVVSSHTGLALSAGGSHLAILDDGTLSIYQIGAEKLVTAIRLADGLHRAAVVFTSTQSLRVFGRAGEEVGVPLQIAEVDLASGEVVVTGEIRGVGAHRWFAVDGPLENLIVSSKFSDRSAPDLSLYKATDGSLVRRLDIPGFPRFLQDGRLLYADAEDDSLTLAVESVDGDQRVTHEIESGAEQAISGEAVPGQVLVSRLEDPADRTRGLRIELVDLESGERRAVGSRLLRAFPWFPWQPGQMRGFFWYNSQPAASRLFYDRTGAVVRWDPASGKLIHVVGGRE